MSICHKCSVTLLVGGNWSEGNAKVPRNVCRPCQSEYNRAYQRKNKATVKSQRAEYRASNVTTIRETDRARYVERPDRRHACSRRGRSYYESNRELVASRHTQWKKDNPERARFLSSRQEAKRRARKLNQTPPDADDAKIAEFYAMAARMSRITGKPYHVDHIRSLASGGLHHQDNLVVMAATLNLTKGTQHWPWLTWFNEPSE
jgi:hypothetical protein